VYGALLGVGVSLHCTLLVSRALLFVLKLLAAYQLTLCACQRRLFDYLNPRFPISVQDPVALQLVQVTAALFKSLCCLLSLAQWVSLLLSLLLCSSPPGVLDSIKSKLLGSLLFALPSWSDRLLLVCPFTSSPYVALRCCSSPPGVLDSIKATLLGSLLFVDSADLLAEWRHSGGRAAATAAALAAPNTLAVTTSSTGTDATDASNSSSGSSGVFCQGLSDPHPALQLLLSVDVPAVVAVLAEATAGWDAVETDLRAAAGKPASELESVLVATQVGASQCGDCVRFYVRCYFPALPAGSCCSPLNSLPYKSVETGDL
jgi:hypothetical protein